MKQIGQGRTADIFEHHEDENMIIKLYKRSFPEDAINQEFQISNLVYSLGINTPQPIELIQLDHRKGIIFRRISGVSLLKIMGKSPLSINKHSRKLATLHHNLHGHHVVGELRQQKNVLSNNIKSASALTESEKNIIIDYLEKLPHDNNRLCHGDYHPDNVMVGEENWIIDWMTGMYGNPAGDVARSVILLSTGTMPNGTSKHINSVINFLRDKLKKEYVRHYIELSGLDYADIDRWILPVAAARLVEWMPKEEQEQLLKIIKERLRAVS
ncbi:aminoglycoside phosphotransferase family protein [Paenibacillus sp. 7541]|uniref:aminoglycoside phosphotransferase family protein n=1 Tax=Paenibacillus sp. 7541 TaxID=2026236 RepID=UPI000BA5D1C6|nr:aminoglycoside phosphotransferase family protein [Paenibacillus sp. 7541]PAK55758.1 hypothetical protein CHH75_00370 [Paenibacillus sp. 7541]